MKLDVYYDSETDTLSLWNGQPASAGADVAENLTVDLDAEGEVVGFTLDHASEMLKSIVARPLLAGNPKGQTSEGSPVWALPFVQRLLKRELDAGSPVWALPFPMENSEGMTLENNEWSSEMLKSIVARPLLVGNPKVQTPDGSPAWALPFPMGNPEGMTLENSEWSTEMLKAIVARPLLAENPEGMTLEDNERLTEMLNATGVRLLIVENSEGFTPEDIEKWRIRPTVWVGHIGHFVDSGKK